MNWKEELIRLYEVNEDKAGEIEYKGETPYTLLPLYHSTVTAQIEVTIYEDGSFMNAAVVDGNDRFTVIPVTEKSGSRTAGKEPHPLCDNLKYIAGDYKNYVDDNGECFDLYINQLGKWANSDYSHYKVNAIYEYLKKQTLINDLLKSGVLSLDDNGVLSDSFKIQNIPQTKAFVRFIVRGKISEEDEYIPDECWLDKTLQNSYIKYAESTSEGGSLCYLSGNVEPITYLHSRKVRNEGDSGKLISANDEVCFTFRGRFANKEEAFAIGNEASQKLHNALKWIIRKQGTYFDTLTLVAWESALKSMPDWDKDTYTIAESYDEYDDSEEEYYSNDIIAQKFNNALLGYGKSISDNSNMTLLGIDAATTGRLALVEEKTLSSAKYLKNIKNWHESCKWRYEKFNDGKFDVFYGILSVRDIADILFGKENDKGFLSIIDANSKSLYAETARRLIPCIWEGQRIPYDYVERAVLRASQPLSYNERRNWEKTLALACSFVKRYRYDRNKEEWNMALDKDCKDRNYLYGRLLALANQIEYSTYDFDKDKTRITNAMKYMNRFSQRPFDTWKVIEENLNPYLSKLDMGLRSWYEKRINEIMELFDTKDFVDNSKLNGLYLLGYHCQTYELRNSKSKNEEDN